MNTKIKDVLGVAGIIAVLLTGYAASKYAGAYADSIEPSSFRSFTVSGEGKVVAVPDIARFDFSVLTEGGTDITSLYKSNTEKVNKTIAFLKSKGIDAKDIKTENYSVNPRYQSYRCDAPNYDMGGMPMPCPPGDIIGYTIYQSVSVKIRDFSKIAEVVSGVIENGANQVGGISFTIDDPLKVQNEAREEAIAKAKEKAKLMARAGGFGVGRLLSIDEGGGYYPMYEAYGRGGAMDGIATKVLPAPAIEPGSQDVTVTVTLRYEIE